MTVVGGYGVASLLVFFASTMAKSSNMVRRTASWILMRSAILLKMNQVRSGLAPVPANFGSILMENLLGLHHRQNGLRCDSPTFCRTQMVSSGSAHWVEVCCDLAMGILRVA